MDPTDEMAERIKNGSREACLALAAACGERVVPVFDNYWVGDHTKSVARAVELGWIAACGGNVDKSEVEACRVAVADFVDYYNEESIGILAGAVTVALRILECIGAENDDVAAMAVSRACGSALEVGSLVDYLMNGRQGSQVRPAMEEEDTWQAEALCRVEGWKGVARRDMFSGFGSLPPRWWPAYQAAPEQL